MQRSPIMAAYGDIDGDGLVDAVVCSAEWFVPRLAVLRNTGDLKFTDRRFIGTLKPAGGVVLLDVDRDGDLDAVITEPDQYGNGTTVGVYRNDGLGNFGARAGYAAGVGPVGPVVADFDNDGILDLAVANNGFFGDGSTVSVLYGNGTGGFSAPLTIATEDGARQIAVGDFDNDGWLDMAVARDAHAGHQSMLALVRNGHGRTFDAAVQYDATPPEFWAPNGPSCVTAGDMDRDGNLDVVFSANAMYDGTTGGFLVFRNNGNGTLAPKEPVSWQIPYTQGVVDIAVVDFDGDGWLDVVGTQFTDVQSNCYFVVRRGPNGEYLPADMYAAGTGSQSLAVRDFDGDAKPDIAIVNNFSYTVSLHLNQGNGQFWAPTTYLTIPLGFSFDLGDIDGDGDLDVLTSGSYADSGALGTQRNDGAGHFDTAVQMVEDLPPGHPIFRDLDQDGDLDILFCDATAPPGQPLHAHWKANDGVGNFGASQFIYLSMAAISDLETADLNADGYLDILAVDPLRNEFKAVMGLGGGQFGPVTIIPGPTGIAHVLAADFNHDARLDVASVDSQPYGYNHTIGVFLGRGDGTFDPFTAYNTDDSPVWLDAADLDGDHDLDLVVVNSGFQNDPSPSYSVFMGRGDGTFETERRYTDSAINVPGMLALQDLDGDGKVDLAIANNKANSVGVYPGNGDGTFGPQIQYGVGFSPLSFQLKDVNGDSVVDIFTITSSSNRPLAETYLTVVAGRALNIRRGDCDCDGRVDFNDINAFVQLLSDPAGWQTAHPGCPAQNGDIDDNGLVDFNDINPFVALLTGA